MNDEEEGDPQFGCYMAPEEAKALTDYARGLEISRPKLGILLVLRELRCNRLASLPRSVAAATPKKGSKRVTARPIHPETKGAFAAHAARHGLGSDEATAILFRAELDEKWLDGCIGP